MNAANPLAHPAAIKRQRVGFLEWFQLLPLFLPSLLFPFPHSFSDHLIEKCLGARGGTRPPLPKREIVRPYDVDFISIFSAADTQ